ncbi:1-acyl-sn-glycerol-3-phosphate acyltransferase [Microbacterium protaetiae]|uniref:1-acyl-sn-glycerol-3-phosphate acyltransferase n=1 Tax=Microbacterium protaetiae TaxID=2509458 RepID=A0A4P6ESX6_9MICO|nr:lysophospholipid acyltransferase family protein [Microbacterium protaetiae]QAY61118.1 1-acyl-sn-glycerol-3-phosphate acyltransferase [Microbacterium protaetiae]
MSESRPRASKEKTRPSVFWLLGAIIVPIFGALAKIEITGAEKLPREGAFVLAANHHSEIDPLVVAVAVWRLGRAPRFMAKESLFHVPVLGWALKRTGMVPVARTASSSGARATLETSRDLVQHGRGVIVYPEGTLTRDPELWPMRGKSGAVRLAAAGGIPVIPMAQWGAQQIMPRYGKLRLWPPRRRMSVVIGDPVDIDDARHEHVTPAELNAATTRVMDRIAELLGEIRGLPAPKTRWNPADHGQKETGRLDS